MNDVCTNITLRFNAEKQISVTESGEHRTVTLICCLPPDFAGVTHGEVMFIQDTQALPPYPFPATNGYIDLDGQKLRIRLWGDLTAKRFLRLIVTGYTDSGQKVVSPPSELLRFSGCGSCITQPQSTYEALNQRIDALERELADTANAIDPSNP